MKTIFALLITLTFAIGGYAQIETPIKWGYGAKKTSANEATVFIKATIQPGWHIYSTKVKSGGPIKTSFIFAASKDYKTLGKPIEPTPKIKYEKDFKMNVGYFEKEVVFQQKIKLLSPKATVVTGQLEYAVCNNVHCLPPEDLNFKVALN